MAGETERIIDTLLPSRILARLEHLATNAELDAATSGAFIAWGVALVESISASSQAGLSGYRDQLERLKNEFRSVHAGLAAGWMTTGAIDEGLVCRRTFLGQLIDTLEPLVGHAPSPARIVRTAA